MAEILERPGSRESIRKAPHLHFQRHIHHIEPPVWPSKKAYSIAVTANSFGGRCGRQLARRTDGTRLQWGLLSTVHCAALCKLRMLEAAT